MTKGYCFWGSLRLYSACDTCPLAPVRHSHHQLVRNSLPFWDIFCPPGCTWYDRWSNYCIELTAGRINSRHIVRGTHCQLPLSNSCPPCIVPKKAKSRDVASPLTALDRRSSLLHIDSCRPPLRNFFLLHSGITIGGLELTPLLITR